MTVEAKKQGKNWLSIFDFKARQKEKERIIQERTSAFLDFMRKAGVNIDKLNPEAIAIWCGNVRIRVLENSLVLSSSLNGAYLWSDTEVDFNLADKSLASRIVQKVTTAPRGLGDLPLTLSGGIEGISEIRSEGNRQHGYSISFRDTRGRGFDLSPHLGIVYNFNSIGDQPRS